MQIPRSAAEKHAHWLGADELDYIMAASGAQIQHERLCARVMIRSAIATCLGTGVKLSVRTPPSLHLLQLSRI